MKITNSKALSNGNFRITAEIGKDDKLIAVSKGAHYKLNDLGDVVPAHFLYDSELVQW